MMDVCREHYKFMGWTCVLPLGHGGAHSRVPREVPGQEVGQSHVVERDSEGVSQREETRNAVTIWDSNMVDREISYTWERRDSLKPGDECDTGYGIVVVKRVKSHGNMTEISWMKPGSGFRPMLDNHPSSQLQRVIRRAPETIRMEYSDVKHIDVLPEDLASFEAGGWYIAVPAPVQVFPEPVLTPEKEAAQMFKGLDFTPETAETVRHYIDSLEEQMMTLLRSLRSTLPPTQN